MTPLWRRRRPPPGAADLARRLDELGFFRYLEARGAEAASSAIEREGIDAIWKVETGRMFFAGDAEDLAEGGVGDFVRELQPFLTRLGVQIGEIEDSFDEEATSYRVRVDGRSYTIYDLGGQDAAAKDDTERLWGLAWTHAFELLNDLLERAGAAERAYAAGESQVWFLTPELFDALAAEITEARDRPYTPVAEPPWFGQPH